jgi:hypothetical protein
LQLSDRSGYWLANYSVTGRHAYVVDRRNYSSGRGTLRRSQSSARECSAIGSVVCFSTRRRSAPLKRAILHRGEYSVRGYRPGTFAETRGYTVNVEVHHPLYVSSGEGRPTGDDRILLFDHGYVKPFRPPNSLLRSYERRSSVGWGLKRLCDEARDHAPHFRHALNDLLAGTAALR